jgi:peptidoglycan-N-acetylglucosamine deacetylase
MNTLWTAASFLTGNMVRIRGARTATTSRASSGVPGFAPVGPAVYLTFDDGPHPQHTPALLDVLERHGAKGSFYLIGREAEKYPDVVRALLGRGHAIGNHSMFHPKMRGLSARAQRAEIDRADAVLQRFDGVARHAFRPPNGRVTWPALAVALRRRQPLMLWTIDSLDYTLPAAEVAKRLSARTITDGDVILFHDDAPCAAAVLSELLPAWKARGLQFPALT